MYHVPLSSVTKELRQKGKIAALLLQYQGSTGALQKADTPMTEDDMLDLVKSWRASCPHITKYWLTLEAAALDTVRTKRPVKVGPVTFKMIGADMYIVLPVGRAMIYRNVAICESKHTGNPAVDCDNEEKGKIIRKQMYGGMYCENIVQGIARDILADHLVKCRASCVLHVHDEVVLENAEVTMVPPAWCDGLPLDIAGFKSGFYKKD